MIKRKCKHCKKFFIIRFKSEKKQFCNLSCSSTYNGLGRVFTKETKLKMSKMKKGKPLSYSHKKNMSISRNKSDYKNNGAFKKGLIPWNKIGIGRIKHINRIKELTLEGRYKGKSILEKNPNWRGGKSYGQYPFEFNDKLKREIRKRFGFQCVLCKKNGYDVHHIDGDKHNNRIDNLVTLCKKHHGKCHGKNNTNREKMSLLIRKEMIKWH